MRLSIINPSHLDLIDFIALEYSEYAKSSLPPIQNNRCYVVKSTLRIDTIFDSIVDRYTSRFSFLSTKVNVHS
jgi:hypothetical protein